MCFSHKPQRSFSLLLNIFLTFNDTIGTNKYIALSLHLFFSLRSLCSNISDF